MIKGILLLLVVIASLSVNAQDIIIKKSGDEVQAKVLEITLDVIKYKKHDNPEGPTISIKKSEVFMIKYANGSKDVISDLEEKSEGAGGDNKSDNVTVTYSKVEYPKTEKDRDIYNAIKANPILIFSGDIPIYYERRIADRVSLEGGLGITHTDYLYNTYSLDILDEEERVSSVGYSAVINLKYYPSQYSKALDEMYFGPEIRFKHYNATLVSYGGAVVSPQIKEYRKFLDFKLSGGYIMYLSDRVLVDVYGGVGLRVRKVQQADCTFSGPVLITTFPLPVTDVLPVISAGFKFGFGF